MVNNGNGVCLDCIHIKVCKYSTYGEGCVNFLPANTASGRELIQTFKEGAEFGAELLKKFIAISQD